MEMYRDRKKFLSKTKKFNKRRGTGVGMFLSTKLTRTEKLKFICSAKPEKN
jgi:hypothetical protein